MSGTRVMQIEDSKIIEWLSTGLLSLGGIIFSYGIYLGRKHLKKIDNLERVSKFIVSRKELNEVKERLRKTELENMALRMSMEDGKDYEVIHKGDLGHVIIEVTPDNDN